MILGEFELAYHISLGLLDLAHKILLRRPKIRFHIGHGLLLVAVGYRANDDVIQRRLDDTLQDGSVVH